MAEETPDAEQIKKIVEQVIEEQKKETGPNEDETTLQKCVVDCSNAKNVGIQTLRYCLEQGGKFADPENLNKIQDCNELCNIVCSFLLRKSVMTKEMLKICQKACEDCSLFCQQFKEDKQLEACGKYANQASESCKHLA